MILEQRADRSKTLTSELRTSDINNLLNLLKIHRDEIKQKYPDIASCLQFLRPERSQKWSKEYHNSLLFKFIIYFKIRDWDEISSINMSSNRRSSDSEKSSPPALDTTRELRDVLWRSSMESSDTSTRSQSERRQLLGYYDSDSSTESL